MNPLRCRLHTNASPTPAPVASPEPTLTREANSQAKVEMQEPYPPQKSYSSTPSNLPNSLPVKASSSMLALKLGLITFSPNAKPIVKGSEMGKVVGF